MSESPNDFGALKRALRREYMAGKVDWLHVVHALEMDCGLRPEESQELADKWKLAKQKAWKDNENE